MCEKIIIITTYLDCTEECDKVQIEIRHCTVGSASRTPCRNVTERYDVRNKRGACPYHRPRYPGRF